MIALNALVPAEQTKFLVDLVNLLADARATKDRIVEFHEASAELRAAHEQLQKIQASFTAAENQHKERLAAATAEHKAALAKERAEFDQHRLTAENAAAARDKRLAEMESKAAADADANAARAADLERRIALVRQASAA